MFSVQKSNRANLNPTTARPLATIMQGGQAPCRHMHPADLHQRGGGSSKPPPPPHPSVRACTESIKGTIKQRSPNLLVEYRILQDVDNHGEWYEHYFGSSSELSSGIPVSNLSPSTIYEFQVTLRDSQKQDKYFSATTSGCTLPGKLLVMIIFHELGY